MCVVADDSGPQGNVHINVTSFGVPDHAPSTVRPSSLLQWNGFNKAQYGQDYTSGPTKLMLLQAPQPAAPYLIRRDISPALVAVLTDAHGEAVTVHNDYSSEGEGRLLRPNVVISLGVESGSLFGTNVVPMNTTGVATFQTLQYGGQLFPALPLRLETSVSRLFDNGVVDLEVTTVLNVTGCAPGEIFVESLGTCNVRGPLLASVGMLADSGCVFLFLLLRSATRAVSKMHLRVRCVQQGGSPPFSWPPNVSSAALVVLPHFAEAHSVSTVSQGSSARAQDSQAV